MADADPIPFASSAEMAKRSALAYEFFVATNAEVIPFVSDEANWFAFDYLETEELCRAVKEHYGFDLDPLNLKLPFWRFLDYLQAYRKA